MFTMAIGESKDLLLTVTDANGNPHPLEDMRLYMTMRRRDTIINKASTLGGGSDLEIEITGAGEAVVHLEHTDTMLLAPQVLMGEVWMVHPDGDYIRGAVFELELLSSLILDFPE
jgi:hypothetical protein